MSKTKHGSAARRTKKHRPMTGGVERGALARDRCLGRAEPFINPDTPLDQTGLTLINASYWMALDLIKKGVAAPANWGQLITGLNFTIVLCEQGFGKEHVPLLITALDAVTRACERGERTGSRLLDGPGIEAITSALEVHDEQTKLTTSGDMKQAARIIDQRVRAGHASRAHGI